MNESEFLAFAWADLNNTGRALVYKDLGTVLEGFCPFNDGDHNTGSISYSTWADLDGDGLADVICETKKLGEDGQSAHEDVMKAVGSAWTGAALVDFA